MNSTLQREDSAQDAYHYPKSLPDNGWFRLLSIAPSNEPSRPLVCRLEPYKMDIAPPYEALSYTWGRQKPENSIELNGRLFLVRPNLHAALLALRRPDENRFLWVDAICINQQNQRERTRQVWQMKQVYRDALRVKVWLGDATKGSQRGVEILRHFEHVSQTATDQHVKSFQDFQNLYADVIPLMSRFESASESEEVFELLRHPWWTRVWTLQEGVLGQDVDCICGQKSVPIECFSSFSWFLYFAINFGIWNGPQIDSSVALKTARWIGKLRDIHKKEGKVTIWGALSASWNRVSTDPKDKVMGLLGLLNFDRAAADMPDYGVSTADNYCKLFYFLLEEANALNPLGLISEMPEDRHPSLPSWVPDFQVHSGVGSDHLASLSKGIHPYDASLSKSDYGFQIRKDLNSNGRVLIAEGIEFDLVDDVGCRAPGWELLENPPPEDERWKEMMQETLTEWRSMANGTETSYPTGENYVRAFWRTVLVDLKQGEFPRPSSALGARRLGDEDLAWVMSLETGAALCRLLLTWEDSCKSGFRQLRLIEQLNRRFFISGKGYFGLGPPSLQAGDAVCILRSGAVAYALRKQSNDCWKYLGECYVHGIMDGEAVQEAKGQGLHYTTFRIE
ncbi:heterokaryon incompatibility [Colletotrichum truncatum]|uniref:Heterokaryon incompatibility n=1 Tax=Colletotrichum truncatum TaxID=5467 RepID=A0ACC3YUH2_COLTU|nr:heterokaryon incompatibility [Colletotrichum truncatum]KAF6785772.1 heterokaryon incompatibility [Colletotrichum truncatum]